MATNARTHQDSNYGPGTATGAPTDSITSGAHDIVDKLARAADEGIRKAKPAIERVADLAHQAVDSAGGVAGATAGWVNAKREGLKTTRGQVLGETCGFVTAYPLKSIAIALVAGILIGRIVR